MNEFGQKGHVSDEYFMVHVLNNLPKEYDVILNGLENGLKVTGDDALTIDSICEKLNHRYKKIKSKKEKKLKKKKRWSLIISNISSSAGNVESMATNLVIRDALKMTMKKMTIIKKQKDMNVKKIFVGVCYHCGQNGHMSNNCRALKNGHCKKVEKAERAIDGDENDLVFCLLLSESKTKSKKKKVQFMEDVKQPSEAGMICTIDGETLVLFTKNTRIGDSGASCHITNNDTGLYDVRLHQGVHPR